MKRKDYQRPTTNVVVIQQRGLLMTSDPEPVGSKARINNWGDGGTTEEDIYI